VPQDEVRLYLAVRESAHARLFARVPWLSGHLIGAVEQYARGIIINTARIEDAVGRVDPSDPQALQEALSSGMFEPERTPAQQAALDRLETALALVEGWVDEVVDAAAGTHLPHAGALREAVRRRRAAGGPAEAALTSLVGLQLRPRRLRDAARLFSVLAAAGGPQARDAVWEHPDLLPTSADLDSPEGYAERRGAAELASADVDAELAQLLGEEGAGGDGGDGGDGGEGERPTAG
jgi:putative hydrolase